MCKKEGNPDKFNKWKSICRIYSIAQFYQKRHHIDLIHNHFVNNICKLNHLITIVNKSIYSTIYDANNLLLTN